MIRHIALVTQLELRKRIHSTRWIAALIAWTVVLLLVSSATVFLNSTFRGSPSFSAGATASAAAVLVHFTALIAITIAASSAAASLNGDRENGMLALMQATPVSGWAIVVGKALAAWINALVFLLVSVPFVGFLLSVLPSLWGGFARGYLVVAIELLAFAGIGMGWSALTPRPGGSSALAVFTVLALLLGGPVVMLGLENLTADRSTVKVMREYDQYWDEEKDEPLAEDDPRFGQKVCESQDYPTYISQVSKFWWLALTNPVVAVADGMPTTGVLPGGAGEDDAECDSDECEAITYLDSNSFHVEPNSSVVEILGAMKKPASHHQLVNDCGPDKGKVVFAQVGDPDAPIDRERGQYWGWTASLHLLLGALMAVVAGRRTRVPIKNLPRGTRIA